MSNLHFYDRIHIALLPVNKSYNTQTDGYDGGELHIVVICCSSFTRVKSYITFIDIWRMQLISMSNVTLEFMFWDVYAIGRCQSETPQHSWCGSEINLRCLRRWKEDSHILYVYIEGQS